VAVGCAQRTIRTAFKEQTVLCIAHRLDTIMHCDRICVMDAGRVAELGPPAELMADKGGMFRALADKMAARKQEA
jgi:ABC-type multidrug transport system fused ATPase/permease subunit